MAEGVTVSPDTWRQLSACLAGDEPCGVETIQDWDALVAMAESAGLGPLLYRSLKKTGRPLPPQVEARLAPAYWGTLKRNLLLSHGLAQLAQAFANAEIPFIILKGFALAETIYPDVGTRGIGDADLLVREQDAERAAELLKSLGYLPRLSAAGYSWDFVRRFHSEQAFYQASQAGCNVDLHWRLVECEWFLSTTRIRLEDMWQRAVPLAMERVPAWQLAPEDTLLHLCLHAAVGHAYSGLRLFVDLDRQVRWGPGLDWRLVVKRARDWRIRNVVYFNLGFTRQLFETPIPDDVLLQLAPPAFVQRVMGRLVNPAGIVRREGRFGSKSAYFLYLLLVDRWQDRLLGLVRVFFPGRNWIAARYSVEHPFMVGLLCALHPLRMIGMTVRALGQLMLNGIFSTCRGKPACLPRADT